MSGLFNFGASAVEAEGVKLQSESEARAAEFNANVARRNAGIQETQTQADIERGRREARVRQGSARAAAGALGGLQGSALDILASNAAQQELDIMTVKQQGALRKQALLEGSQLDIFRAQTSRQAGKLGSAAAMLRGTAQLFARAENMGSKAASGGWGV